MSDNTRNRVQQDPIPADSSDRINFYNNSSSSFPFHISPSAHSTDLFSSNILQLESLNVRSLVSSTKQLDLFSILLSHALHGIILTETNLCFPAHHYICDTYLTSYNFLPSLHILLLPITILVLVLFFILLLLCT